MDNFFGRARKECLTSASRPKKRSKEIKPLRTSRNKEQKKKNKTEKNVRCVPFVCVAASIPCISSILCVPEHMNEKIVRERSRIVKKKKNTYINVLLTNLYVSQPALQVYNVAKITLFVLKNETSEREKKKHSEIIITDKTTLTHTQHSYILSGECKQHANNKNNNTDDDKTKINTFR